MSVVTKFKYDGTRQARRILPGNQIAFEVKGRGIRDTVESVFLFGPDRIVFNTVSGYRVSTSWSDRYGVWVKED